MDYEPALQTIAKQDSTRYFARELAAANCLADDGRLGGIGNGVRVQHARPVPQGSTRSSFNATELMQ